MTTSVQTHIPPCHSCATYLTRTVRPLHPESAPRPTMLKPINQAMSSSQFLMTIKRPNQHHNHKSRTVPSSSPPTMKSSTPIPKDLTSPLQEAHHLSPCREDASMETREVKPRTPVRHPNARRKYATTKTKKIKPRHKNNTTSVTMTICLKSRACR